MEQVAKLSLLVLSIVYYRVRRVWPVPELAQGLKIMLVLVLIVNFMEDPFFFFFNIVIGV